MNNNISNKLIKGFSISNTAQYLFLLGIFFLPSSLIIGILFLVPSAILGSFLHKRNYFEDKWNYPFLIFGSLILLSTFLQNFVLPNNYEEIWDPMLSLVGAGNWIPFLWIFWAFQPYIDSKPKRKSFALILIAGTFPVLITGFGQFFFNWNGPFETLNGLIIWYQRPIENPGGLTGLFNNQNYAGSWLNIAWPFCIALFLEKKNFGFRKTISLSFLISIGFAAFLTYSRNAWIGLITSLPIITGKKIIINLLPIILLCIFLLIFIFSPIFKGELQNLLQDFFPQRILLEFSEEGYEGLNSTRQEILSSAINLLKTSPIFGIGAAAFSQVYFLETTFWKGHSHNLLIELAISYGLPATIIFLTTITITLYLSGVKIFFHKKIKFSYLIDKAFWAALFFFLISQLFDIQYFDGKISIIVWILIAGLKNIITEKDYQLETAND